MMIKAEALKKGNVVKIQGQLCRVMHVEFGGTARFGRLVHIKYRHVEGGLPATLSAGGHELFEEVSLQRSTMEYLYSDSDFYHFMDTNNYEQYPVRRDLVGEAGKFLKENAQLQVELAEGRLVNILFPEALEIKVVEAAPGVRHIEGGTMKEVVLENGAKILAPQFINAGDVVRVNPETGKYIDRVKK